MDDTLWVIIYSKFAPSCSELLHVIQQTGLNDVIHFNTICIDEKSMRKRVLSNKKFNVKIVPCLITIQKSTGVAATYEGQNAFELVNELLMKFFPPPPPPPPPPARSEPEINFTPLIVESVADEVKPLPQPKRDRDRENVSSTMIEDLETEDDLEAVLNRERSQVDRRRVEKVSVSQVMAERERMENVGSQESAKRPEPDFVPKKTGGKVNISEIMQNRESF